VLLPEDPRLRGGKSFGKPSPPRASRYFVVVPSATTAWAAARRATGTR
jgi:hypothetical protein